MAASKGTLELGDRVLLLSDHPWAGHTGTLVNIEMVGVLDKPGLRVRLDNGMECFVLEPRQIRKV